jgi:urease accessory protein UreE
MVMFKSIPVAKKTDRVDTLSGDVLGFDRDSVTLGWEARMRARTRRQSDHGFEFATALPRGTILHEDDCLVFDAQRLIVRVVELEEPMLVVRPASNREWGLFAYHIGNSHQPMMITDDAIVCPDALGMDQILAYHAIPFLREERRFTPLGQIADHQHPFSR